MSTKGYVQHVVLPVPHVVLPVPQVGVPWSDVLYYQPDWQLQQPVQGPAGPYRVGSTQRCQHQVSSAPVLSGVPVPLSSPLFARIPALRCR